MNNGWLLSARRLALGSFLFCSALLAGCGDDETTVNPPTTSGAVDVATLDTLHGQVKGMMQANKTYYMSDDVYVPSGETLTIPAGVKIIILAPTAPRTGVLTLYVRGSILAAGTKDAMISFVPPTNRQFAGAWGGIQCDSAAITSLKWCRIDYAAGLRPDGRPKPAIYFFSNAANTSEFYMEDCTVYKPKDDGFMLYGGRGHILRNNFLFCGEVEGSGPNFKTGFKGEVAYNYIWSCVDQCIRVETSSTVLFPQTDLVIHNNTIINSGHKNSSRPGAAVKIDLNARAKVYNNIFVNTRMGLYITRTADSANTTYGNNLFYSTVDSLRQFYYPADGVGRSQPSDLIDVNPLFVNYDSDVNALTDNNDVHLQATSPAIGAGNPAYDPDLGAYTAKRNQ